MNADFTYDSVTDQFVVTMDDGTEVCRTRAPHRAMHRKAARLICDAINWNHLAQVEPGLWRFESDSQYPEDDRRVFMEEGFVEGEVLGMQLTT